MRGAREMAGESQSEEERQQTDMTKGMSEYWMASQGEREKNRMESERTTYKGREAWMGHIYTPHQRKKRGANRWKLLSIQHSISHLIACQPGLQSLQLPHYRPN